MSFLDKLIYKTNYTKLNFFKTILFNFKLLPLKEAIKFPVFIYGKTDIYFLSGNVVFNRCKVKKGMVKMGYNKEYLGAESRSLIILEPNSTLVFNGKCEFSNGYLLRVGKRGHLSLGNNCFFGSSTKIVCINKISIGGFSRVAFESQIIDSDFHYLYNLKEETIGFRDKSIEIGAYNWIGNRTSISKGVKTKDYTIVGKSSLLTKDYSILSDNYCVLAGQPAKLITSNLRRIFSVGIENDIFEQRNEKVDENFDRELILKIKKHFEIIDTI